MAGTCAPDLNHRQRAYLLAIFETDQAVEAHIRSMPFSPFHDRPKASEWRWMEYSEPIPILNKPASRLYEAIKKAAKIDQGTGSTFDALAARGLVQVGVRGPDGYPHLRVTPAGRKLARSWTGAKAYKAPAAGTLKEWHWRALAKAYAAGNVGLDGSYGDYANIGWNTWLRLRDYKRGALIEERVGCGTTPRLDRQAPGIGSISRARAGRCTSESGPATDLLTALTSAKERLDGGLHLRSVRPLGTRGSLESSANVGLRGARSQSRTVRGRRVLADR